MRLTEIYIENYKSIKHCSFSPSKLSLIVGANAAGKSNFADAFDFISIAYRHGLEYAVGMKGGYENIAYRKARRTKSPIEFRVKCVTNANEASVFLFRHNKRKRKPKDIKYIVLEHRFSFKTLKATIKSDFVIESEEISVYGTMSRSTTEESRMLLKISRSANNISILESDTSVFGNYYERYIESYQMFEDDLIQSSQALLTTWLFGVGPLSIFIRFMSRFATFRLSPALCREPGVPTPNPTLAMRGENLPAVVDWMNKNYPEKWESIVHVMRDIMPDLEGITVQYLHTKTIGLLFKETQSSRAWTADEVSDGTIQALSILIACHDPRNSLLFIEEPENSVHPWIIKLLTSIFRGISKNNTIILTTHSPVVIDTMHPDETWIAFKKKHSTCINKLNEIDPSIQRAWNDGKLLLSEAFDSGLIPQSVPGGIS